MKGAGAPARGSLLRTVGRMGSTQALAALRAGVKDPEPLVRDAAIPHTGGFRRPRSGAGLAPVGSAGTIRDDEGPGRAWLLARRRPGHRSSTRSTPETLPGWAWPWRSGPRKHGLGLSQLAKLPLPAALDLANQMRHQEAIEAEADLACYQIAARLLVNHRSEAEASLRQLASQTRSDPVRQDTKTLLQALDRRSDYLVPWLVSGPFRQKGKEASALFDVVLPPEQAKTERTDWQSAPLPDDPKLFWQIEPLQGRRWESLRDLSENLGSFAERTGRLACHR